MAQQIVNNGDSGLSARTKINANFTELYAGSGAVWGSITGTLSNQTDLQTALNAKQPLDSDLTAIAALTPSNDDIIQRKAGAWTNRTIAQLKTDLAYTASTVGAWALTGTSIVTTPTISGSGTFDTGKWTFTPNATTEGLNIGTTASDPSSPTNGGLWINTTTNTVNVRANSLTDIILRANTTAVNQIPYYSGTNGRMNRSDRFSFDGTALYVGESGGTITANTRLDVRGIASGNIARFATDGNVAVLTAENGGFTRFGSHGEGGIYRSADGINISNSGATHVYVGSTGAATGVPSIAYRYNTGITASGATNHIFLGNIASGVSFAASSGTASFTYFSAAPTFNTTGTYSGTVRGFYWNPTLTSTTGLTHRAIETTSGDWVMSNGNFLVNGGQEIRFRTNTTDQNITSISSTTLVMQSPTLQFSGGIVWNSDISPAQITSNQNDYNPTGWNAAAILRLSTDASRNLTSVAGGVDGRVLIIINVGAQDLVIKDDDGATGTAANRFALNADITIQADEAMMFIYDGTSSRWRALKT